MTTKENPQIQKFLATVLNQIAFREARKEVELELLRHLEDLVQESTAAGTSNEESIQSALERMGDADEIGRRLNRVHTQKLPWLLMLIVGAMIVLGIFNVVESHQLASHSVNILLGMLAGLALFFTGPSHVGKVSAILVFAGFCALGLAAVWGEWYQGTLYVKLLCFNLNLAELSIAPFVLGLGGLIATPSFARASVIKILFIILPVPALLLVGSTYGAVLVAAAVLAMMVTASERTYSVLFVALNYAIAFGASFDSKTFLNADAFAFARAQDLHTDFVLGYFHGLSSGLSAAGIFLSFAVVAQLGTILLRVRSRYSRVMVVGHLSVLALSIIWSMLANLGYVAMPVSGTPLPFVSYGGSFLVGQMALMGMSTGLYWRRTLSYPI